MNLGHFRLIPDQAVTTPLRSITAFSTKRFFDLRRIGGTDTISSTPFDLASSAGRGRASGQPLPGGRWVRRGSGSATPETALGRYGTTAGAAKVAERASSRPDLGAKPLGEPVLEPSTLPQPPAFIGSSRVTDHKNAVVTLDYRKAERRNGSRRGRCSESKRAPTGSKRREPRQGAIQCLALCRERGPVGPRHGL